MAATPTYGFPYPGTGDSPHGPNQLSALALAVEDKIELMDADRTLIKELLKGYTPPAQTGSGTLATGGDGAVIKSVAIPDPGFAYHIIASGGMGWAMAAASVPGRLIECAITINSVVYTTNRITYGCSVSHSLGAGFSQPTVPLPMDRSDAMGAQTGAKTVNLIARNSASPAANMTIPSGGADIKLHVRIVPA